MILDKSQTYALGVFNSNEPVFSPKFFRYPFNSITSFIFWLPLLYIPVEFPLNINENTNIIGFSILSCLAPVSCIWWATSNKFIKYIDNSLVLSTKIWLLSILTHSPKLNIIIPFLFYLRNDNFIKNLEIANSVLLVWFNPNIISNSLFLLSLCGKLSDSNLGYQYGTALFHIFSGLAITVYFRDEN